MKKTILFLFFFLSINCLGQFSKTHYIPVLTSQNDMAEDHYLYISTPSLSNVNFKIIEIGGTIITGFVSNKTPYIYNIGSGNNTQLFTPKTQIEKINNKGYIIEAEDLVYASVRINSLKINDGTYNHAGGLVSKGNSALGKEFRLGAMLNPIFDPLVLNFASILSTENGTKITISNIPNGAIFSNGTIVSSPINITLNKNESYVLALENYYDGNPITNSSKMIGASIQSDKPVIVNSGSFGGSNSDMISDTGYPVGRDLGFDQIVSFEKTGKEYIFVKGYGTDDLERVLLIAHKPQTAIYLNGSPTPFITLSNPGEYAVIDGNQFVNGNLYVSTSENVFAYQSIGGTDWPANQNLFFVPPLNCATPNSVDNIPLIESIGNVTFNGGINIVTETAALVKINETPITATPISIIGNPGFVRYTVVGLSGNIAVKSDKQVYISYFGTNGAATYGGYYSGFDLKPEIVTDKITVANSLCIPNVNLKINSLSSFDSFQWFRNDIEITGETNNYHTPTTPGFYKVRGSISACGTTIFSDNIPVSECPTNIDSDLVNDNVDLDNDNDGITNCMESYGNQNIDISNTASGAISAGTYSNSFTGTISGTGSFTGKADGSFITEVPAGKSNGITYTMYFAKPISTIIEYIPTANPSDLLNPDSEYIVNSDINKTITVRNLDNQLLIDTNYDGIYETGITEYSSFEIRFRLNSTIPLAAGTGTFQFLTHLSNSISFTHKNLSDDTPNRSSLIFFASCIPKDYDGDEIPDQLDTDSDNDQIPDIIESQPSNSLGLFNIDSNKNGLDDAFELNIIPVDTDTDGIPDYLDADSDNDGILDLIETGIDTDNDGIKNYRDLDSDNDLCSDVIEAGFLDANGDGILGSQVNPTVNTNGQVTSGVGYTIPNSNHILYAPIIITSQPAATPTCESESTKITLADNADTYQWQFSADGIHWTNLVNNAIYSDVATNILTITSVSTTMLNYKYRVVLNKTGNSCGLTSDKTTLTVYPLPIVNNTIITQCDDDLDGISTFNLTVQNDAISSNATNETFTYYKTLTGANTADVTQLIQNPLAFVNTIPNTMSIWSRVENSNNCFRIAEITLKVSVTQINVATFHRNISKCDDSAPSDTDGFSEFDFQNVTTDIQNVLPSPSSNYSIKYYATEANALSEINEITNTANYRNTIKNKQDIWVRVDSNLNNTCFGLGPFITLTVNPYPKINLNTDGSEDKIICSNLPSYFVQLSAAIQDGSPTTNYTYAWSKDGTVINNETASALDVNTEGIYTVEVKNTSGCSRIKTFLVSPSDIASIQSTIVVDMTDNNTVTINVTGTGNYEYSLDQPSGNFQDSNVFTNVTAGIHDIYINDKNNCGTVRKTIAVARVPKFFTPNSDGENDHWKIIGLNADYNANAIIYIFDRYGKLLKQIKATSEGWDGTFNGLPSPAADYWYTIQLEDGREVKGHFSLKR